MNQVEAIGRHAPANRSNWIEHFRRVRSFSLRIAEPLSAEDCAMQSMPDVSPTRWHLAHTTWFFETFVLRNAIDYQPYDPRFEALFNSYYNAIGQQFPRDRRGTISRPGLQETLDYRQHIDEQVEEFLQRETLTTEQLGVLELGCHHEQQHQELMLTDMKHVLYSNPLYPTYSASARSLDNAPQFACDDGVCDDVAATPMWFDLAEEIVEIGAVGPHFCFDNELPRHRAWLPARQVCSRLVRNGEFLEFIGDGGYERPELWLSLGWEAVQQSAWRGPLYWDTDEHGCIWQFRLDGRKLIDPLEPVCHVSYFEADAFARWAGARLLTEQEWEAAANSTPRASGGFFADRLFAQGQPLHPGIEQACDCFLGNVWEWTSSHYSPYPGFRPAPGALGEYNGKFMCNQFVLRGGSCATPSDHIRPSYRNFFSPTARWQFSGIRLAK